MASSCRTAARKLLPLSIFLLALATDSRRSGAVKPCDQPGYCLVAGTTPEALEAQIRNNGTMFSAPYEAGRATVSGIDPERVKLPFDRTPDPLLLTVWAPYDDPPDPKKPTRWPRALQADVHAQLASLDLSQVHEIELQFAGASGAADTSVKLSAKKAAALRTKLAKAKIPKDGGLVDLRGGKWRFRQTTSVLADAQLDVCGTTYCLRFSSPDDNPAKTGETLELPFAPSPLFTVTWDLAYRQRVDAFYLSINPTEDTLRSDDPASFPTKKIRLTDSAAGMANEIVTRGGIDGTELGQILLDADLAFKSADLGFDVKVGRSSAATVSPDDLPDPMQPLPDGLGRSRWCRFAWQSNDQVLEPTKKGVRLSGPAIRAEAEPMRLRFGVLEPYPEGRWCADAKTLARKLNRSLEKGKARKEVAALERVASIQNLATFALANHVTPSAAFEASLSDNPPVKAKAVPKGSSGIRSNTKSYVRLDYRRERDGTISRALFVYCSRVDCTEIDEAVKDVRTELSKLHWGNKEGNLEKAEAILERAQTKLAETFDLSVLPLLDDAREVPNGDFEFAAGANTIQLPVSIHGGVLLRAQQAERAALEATTLTLDERPIFRVDAIGTLHFWSFDHDGWKADDFGPGEHLEIRDAKVRDRYAVDGTLRWVIEGKSLTARSEVRFPATTNYPRGVEWTRSIARRGAVADVGIAAWIYGAEKAPFTTSLTSAQAREARLPVDALGVRLVPLEGALWLVEVKLPYGAIADELVKRHDAAVSAADNVALSRAVQLANTFGARDLADRWREELFVESDPSRDTLFAEYAGDRYLFSMALKFAIADAVGWFDDATHLRKVKHVGPRLETVELLTTSLPPDIAGTFHARIAAQWRDAATTTKKKDVKKALLAAAKKHETLATIATALATGR
jgi:hypothetical protein